MSKLLLAADRPVREYESALVELLEDLSKYKVTGMAVVVMVEPREPDDEDILAFYHRMSIRDKQLAAAVIEGDVHYAIAEDAIRHYMGDEGECDNGGETERGLPG